LVALITVEGIDASAQLTGIAITVVIAIIGGFVTGKILSFTGRRNVPYTDSEEFGVESD